MVGNSSASGTAATTRLYRNDGNGYFRSVTNSLPNISSGSAAWGDYDNDGDKDVLIGGGNGTSYETKLFRNDGLGIFTEINTVFHAGNEAKVAWCDLDNDGALDATIHANQPVYCTKVYKNNNGSFEAPFAEFPSTSKGNFSIVDYDGDGDMDLLRTGTMVATNTGATILYCNDNSDSPMPPTAPSLSIDPASGTISFAGATDDTTPALGLTYNLRIGTTPGGCDVLSPMSNSATGYRSIVQGGRKVFTKLILQPDVTYYASGQSIDNSYQASGFGNEIAFSVTWDYVSFNPVTITLPALTNSAVSWGDYDNDGDMDLVVSGDISPKVYRNDGLGVFTDIYISMQVKDGASAAWGDYDNDGDLDLLVAGRSYSNNPITTLYRNDANIFTEVSSSLAGVISAIVAWGDYDNDGYLDILISGTPSGQYAQPLSRVYRNQRNGTFANINAGLQGITSANSSPAYSTWVDYDNDGDLDIFLMNGSSAITKLYRNDGNGLFTSITTNITNIQGGSAAWGDYDSDGDMDLLICGSTGTIYVSKIFRNDGAGLFTDINVSLHNGSNSAVAWGDMDNDGDLDAIIYTRYPSSYGKIYKNEDGIFSSAIAEFPFISDGSISIVDYDSDGDIDVLYPGNPTTLYRNDNDDDPAPPTAPSLSIDPASGTFSFAGATDDTTPALGLTYNLRIGTTPGGCDVLSPMSNSNTGYRGIVQGGLQVPVYYELPPGSQLYSAAKSLDYSFNMSPFSEDVEFTSAPLKISYPNGGQQLVSGSTSYISWDNNWVRKLKIQLSTDDGLNWIDISGNYETSDPNIFFYTVPSANSSSCRMKISWWINEAVYDVSDTTFAITTSTTAPRISVLTPNDPNLILTPGMLHNITWDAQNVAAVSLDYTSDNGLSWQSIIENLPALPASYNWTVPDDVSNLARIRIRKADNHLYYDISDNPFTNCKLTILSPNGGEVWTTDHSGLTSQTILWDSPYVTNLQLFYSTNSGTSWTSIATVSGASGRYIWTPPAIESAQCLVKGVHTNASFVHDTSDASFILRYPIQFTNCMGGGYLNNNTSFRMRWQIRDVQPEKMVFIEYSTNNTTWARINIDAIPVTNNEYTFFLGVGSATQVWFRMLESGPNRILARSSSSMMITDKQIHVITPMVGAELGVDSYSIVTWTSDGCSNLNISYSADNGVSWFSIAENIPSSQLSFVWQVPNTPSNLCRIKLQDTTYSYMNIESDGEFSIIPLDVESSFFATNTTGYSDLEVSFFDQSIGYISSWDWDFDSDGQTDSHDQNPTWIYSKSGFHSVTLTVTDGDRISSTTRDDYIYVYPMVANFGVSETSGFAPFSIQFTDLTPSDITQWAWDFDNNGSIDADYQNPYWTYLFPGTYTVKQHVTNGYDSDIELKTNYITVSLDESITHYVPTDYLAIQAAINASVDGDYIIVADGTYYENLLIEGKNITLGSYFLVDGDSTHISNTIIDGGNAINPDQASTLTILPASGRPDTKPHIVGFTIRNGSGRRIVQNEGGTTIEKRVGGGVYIRQSNPIFSYNMIEDNDADDEGGGSYAFQSLPNHGGMVNAAIGLFNPGGNYFAANTADIGADLYIYGVTNREPLKLENCSFEVMSIADTTVSNYWVNSSSALSYTGSSGRETAITTDVYVATNGSDTLNSGTSASSPFKTIDHALSRIYATTDNTLTIHIASGTYSPSLTGEKYPLQMVKHVSLQGSGTAETFLDAEASADFPRRVLNLDKLEDVSISDLTIMGGFVTMAKNYNGGGIGIIGSTANLSNILLAGSSSAGNGAGLYAFQSSVTADSISLEYNAALGSGGGLYAMETNLELSNSNVLNNSANKNGAGIAADYGTVRIMNSEIANNQATGYQSKGGGISLSNTNAALIRNNQLKANNADLGAGIYLQNNAELNLDRNTISNNLADFNGGGLFVNTTTGLLTNNLIANNTASQRGGAIYCYSAPEITNCTIVNNKANQQGGGLYQNTGSPLHTNSIYWGNVMGAANTPNQVYLYSEAADPGFNYCNIQGGSSGFALASGITYTGTYTNNLDSDPMFCEPTEAAGHFQVVGEASFTMLDSSPCIDSGDPTTDASNFPLDLNGNPRIDNTTIDIGAYEAIHYNGAMITANPTAIDFGRVNIHATPPTAQLTITNTGNQDLIITDIGLEFSTAVFSYEIGQRTLTLNPGASITLNLTFSPSAIGTQANNLIIESNALNYITYRIPISGTGIDASTSYPSNVQLQVIGDDVHLSWDPVLSDYLGNPYTPDGYIVLYSENVDTILDNYFILAFREEPNYIHLRVTTYRNKMFYKIISIDDNFRLALRNMYAISDSPKPITWGELKGKTRIR